ncbi:hypothetical protein K438DRAFT_534564 [Mycena galopus ATCC 62051]|nr:hypothetical protein K438DRAFT_534564 [Mycena galopus ATCC 62051]
MWHRAMWGRARSARRACTKPEGGGALEGLLLQQARCGLQRSHARGFSWMLRARALSPPLPLPGSPLHPIFLPSPHCSVPLPLPFLPHSFLLPHPPSAHPGRFAHPSRLALQPGLARLASSPLESRALPLPLCLHSLLPLHPLRTPPSLYLLPPTLLPLHPLPALPSHLLRRARTALAPSPPPSFPLHLLPLLPSPRHPPLATPRTCPLPVLPIARLHHSFFSCTRRPAIRVLVSPTRSCAFQARWHRSGAFFLSFCFILLGFFVLNDNINAR